MLATYIAKEESTSFIIAFMLLNRATFTLNNHFKKYETRHMFGNWLEKLIPALLTGIIDISK